MLEATRLSLSPTFCKTPYSLPLRVLQLHLTRMQPRFQRISLPRTLMEPYKYRLLYPRFLPNFFTNHKPILSFFTSHVQVGFNDYLCLEEFSGSIPSIEARDILGGEVKPVFNIVCYPLFCLCAAMANNPQNFDAQNLRTCQAYADHGGLTHQSLMIETPKYRKQYLVPEGCISEDVKPEKVKGQSSCLRNVYSRQASTECPSCLIDFSFTKSASRKGVG